MLQQLKVTINVFNAGFQMQLSPVNHSVTRHRGSAHCPLYLFQQVPAERGVVSALPAHKNIAPVLHQYVGDTAVFRAPAHAAMAAGRNRRVELPDVTSFVVQPLYSSTLGRLVEAHKQTLAANQLSAICDVTALPEEFIAQKL